MRAGSRDIALSAPRCLSNAAQAPERAIDEVQLHPFEPSFPISTMLSPFALTRAVRPWRLRASGRHSSKPVMPVG